MLLRNRALGTFVRQPQLYTTPPFDARRMRFGHDRSARHPVAAIVSQIAGFGRRAVAKLPDARSTKLSRRSPVPGPVVVASQIVANRNRMNERPCRLLPRLAECRLSRLVPKSV
jgi:hypothetical protein